MAAYRRVYDSRLLQTDCQEAVGNRVWATFTFTFTVSVKQALAALQYRINTNNKSLGKTVSNTR